MHPIGLTVVYRDPVGIKLCGRVGRARIEWSRLLLRDLLCLAEQLGRGRLIEAGLLFPAEDTNGLEQAQRSKPVGIGGVFRSFEGDLHMRLGREIVNLVRLRFLHDADDISRVGHVALMQVE
jgi:hypothetical protein